MSRRFNQLNHPVHLTKQAVADILEGMGTMLNNQFMCTVERILKTIFMLALQVAQDVPCKIDFIMPLLVSVYLMHVTQRAPACPATSYTGQQELP